MNRMSKWLLLLFIILMGSTTASAAPVENDSPGISNGIFEADYTRLPDDSEAYYQVDLSDTTAQEQENNAAENFVENIQNFNPIGNTAEDAFNTSMNSMINVALDWNMMMVNFMIGVLNFGFETDIINAWIDNMDGIIQQMAGVSDGRITGGLFGALAGLAAMAAGVAIAYKMVLKGSAISGINTLIKSATAFALAFFLFANFGDLMKGMNEVSSQISATMLTGTMNTLEGDNRTSEEVREEVAANLWNEFIGRPYMIMQYGTDDIDKIGESRVNELLAMKPGDDRKQFVSETEVGDRNNETMTAAAISDKAAFTLMYSVINALVSLPILLLGFALVVFQLWFLMIAFLSPFALIVAAFPGQFGVLQRYVVELIYPLICKVIATVGTLFVFTLGFMIYSIDIQAGISRYFISALMQFGLFSVFFLGRKRIAGILSAGNRGPLDSLRNDMNGLKHAMNDAAGKIGAVGKLTAHVGLAAVTGGSSAVGSAVGAGATAMMANKAAAAESAAEEMPEKNQYSAPIVPASVDAEPPVQPERTQAATQPIDSNTATDVPEDTETTEKQVDLTKPLVLHVNEDDQDDVAYKEGGKHD